MLAEGEIQGCDFDTAGIVWTAGQMTEDRVSGAILSSFSVKMAKRFSGQYFQSKRLLEFTTLNIHGIM